MDGRFAKDIGDDLQFHSDCGRMCMRCRTRSGKKGEHADFPAAARGIEMTDGVVFGDRLWLSIVQRSAAPTFHSVPEEGVLPR
jgi:hypothetical protein